MRSQLNPKTLNSVHGNMVIIQPDDSYSALETSDILNT
jgi:hypothetical protein